MWPGPRLLRRSGDAGFGGVEVARDRGHHLVHVGVWERVSHAFEPQAAGGRDGGGEPAADLLILTGICKEDQVTIRISPAFRQVACYWFFSKHN